MKVMYKGKLQEFENIKYQMDPKITKGLDNLYSYEDSKEDKYKLTPDSYIEVYCIAHKKTFGNEFEYKELDSAQTKHLEMIEGCKKQIIREWECKINSINFDKPLEFWEQRQIMLENMFHEMCKVLDDEYQHQKEIAIKYYSGFNLKPDKI